MLQHWLVPFVVPILAVGLVAHAWGMFDKHRAESAGNIRRAAWENGLYWSCWFALVALIAYLWLSSAR